MLLVESFADLRLLFPLELFQGQRVRSEVIDNDIDASSSSGPRDEGRPHWAHTTSMNGVNVRASDQLCIQGSQENSQEVRPCPENSQWVEVKLGTEHLQGSSVDEDSCIVELRVVGGDNDDNAECSINPSTVLATTVEDRNTSEPRFQPQRQSSQHHDISVYVQSPSLPQNVSDVCKTQDRTFPRTVSAMSTDSVAECCRICQQSMDEPLIELGCHCRGDLAKAHRTCIQQWFNNKGTNKCEVCRYTATNLQAPVSPPLQNFWVWRLSQRHQQAFRRWQRRGRFHPLLAALLILIAGLLFDVLISYYLGASALPVNIIIGVLVVLGLGTAARLVVECCHERNVRRSIQRMEMAADVELNNSR